MHVRANWLISLVGLCLCSAAAAQRPVQQTDVPPELVGLPEKWLAAMDEFQVPGFAVIVVRDDRVIYRGCFGYRDLDRKLPVTPSTAFYIASCTKPFTAMGVLRLVDDGKLKLDEPVKSYLSQFELPHADWTGRITVRDLLCHRWGITCGPAVLLDAYTGEITDDRYYQLLKTRGAAGGATLYTNIHFTLAGRVIEAASGKQWRDYLAQVIFRPAGMTSTTGYADEMYAREDVAIPYQLSADGMTPAPRKTDATMHAAGGLGMSIDDLGRWLRLNINRGEIDGTRIVSMEGMDQMLALQSEARQGQIRVIHGFGLGWSLGTYRNGPKYAVHSGGYIGAAAHTSFLPDERIGVAVVTNGDAPAGVFAEQCVSIGILDRLTGGEHPDFMEQIRGQVAGRVAQLRERRTIEQADVTAAGALSQSPDAYEGTYVNETFGTVNVRHQGKHLLVSLGTWALPLLSCSNDQFTTQWTDQPSTGRFELVDGKPAAVILTVGESEVRFVGK